MAGKDNILSEVPGLQNRVADVFLLIQRIEPELMHASIPNAYKIKQWSNELETNRLALGQYLMQQIAGSDRGYYPREIARRISFSLGYQLTRY